MSNSTYLDNGACDIFKQLDNKEHVQQMPNWNLNNDTNYFKSMIFADVNDAELKKPALTETFVGIITDVLAKQMGINIGDTFKLHYSVE